MIAAFDVQYQEEDKSADVAVVCFQHFTDEAPTYQAVIRVTNVADYEPGSFYKRELPCITALLDELETVPDIIVVDGYVNLGDAPGLGAHLKKALPENVMVIGVAKSPFVGSTAPSVLRGQSKHPLYITAAGCSEEQAAEWVKSMHGQHRFPTLLKLVDRLARQGSQA